MPAATNEVLPSSPESIAQIGVVSNAVPTHARPISLARAAAALRASCAGRRAHECSYNGTVAPDDRKGTGRAVILSAHGLTKVYRMGEVEVHALRGVDIDLLAGEFVVLLGPSGSGKSTLLNILGGLDLPSGGAVTYRDQDLTGADESQRTRYRRENVGFVFQFYNLIPSLTARENVALVTDIVRDPMKPEDALEIVGMGHRLDHFPAQLSGGEQQRVAIARAIAKRPAVLLCDEPTGALDIETGRLVLLALERINRELGTTTAVITHNAAIAEMAHRVVVFGDGRVKELRTNAQRKSAEELAW
jgi:putative ABC transport system ATP-binding protein